MGPSDSAPRILPNGVRAVRVKSFPWARIYPSRRRRTMNTRFPGNNWDLGWRPPRAGGEKSAATPIRTEGRSSWKWASYGVAPTLGPGAGLAILRGRTAGTLLPTLLIYWFLCCRDEGDWFSQGRYGIKFFQTANFWQKHFSALE